MSENTRLDLRKKRKSPGQAKNYENQNPKENDKSY